MFEDTIVAVATPQGRGGIGVIRLSGARAVDIARALVGDASVRALDEANVASVADVVDPAAPGEVLDRVVVTSFRAPRSYTGEDVVEFSCHGSPIVLGAVLDALLRAGARAATPGEFTLRAFLNGRVDLAQAEAVRDLVDAQTSHQARRAQRQLRGELSRRLAPLKERLLDIVVHLESTVEFVEDDIDPASRTELIAELELAARDLAALSATYRLGRLVVDGLAVALVGAPNAGKSSVFNRLVEADRAIVTEVPGTTRDLVSERVQIGGIPLRLVDTAGLRETADVVERIGVERTRSAIADADIVLVVIDALASRPEEVGTLFDATNGLSRVAVLNKIDLGGLRHEVEALVRGRAVAVVHTSALTGEGIDDLRSAILDVAGGRSALEQDGILVTNARHHALLVGASGHLDEASAALGVGFSEEVVLVGLHAALRDLGEVTGETAVDDILNRIFSTFCIGK